MKAFLGPPVIALALFALAGCATPRPPAPRLYCPNVAVLDGTSKIALFLPEGEGELGAEIASARITGVAGSCTMIPDEYGLRITFRAAFALTGAAASSGAPVTLPYYVAIVAGPQIITKQTYNLTLAPPGAGATTTAINQPITIETPNNRDTTREEILIGFQLSADQLAYAEANPGS